MQSSGGREDDLWHGKEVSVKYMGQLSTTLVLLLLTPHHGWAENCRPILPKHKSSLLRHICPLTLLSHLWRHILSGLDASRFDTSAVTHFASHCCLFWQFCLFIDHMIILDYLAFKTTSIQLDKFLQIFILFIWAVKKVTAFNIESGNLTKPNCVCQPDSVIGHLFLYIAQPRIFLATDRGRRKKQGNPFSPRLFSH